VGVVHAAARRRSEGAMDRGALKAVVGRGGTPMVGVGGRGAPGADGESKGVLIGRNRISHGIEDNHDASTRRVSDRARDRVPD
jgi:hypothetical protein